MKLRPVLTASAIGMLIAAASAVPAYADEVDTPPDVVVVEAQVELQVVEADTPAPAGETPDDAQNVDAVVEPPTVTEPAPAVEPAPVVQAAPVVEEPPPVVEEPAPVVEEAAPEPEAVVAQAPPEAPAEDVAETPVEPVDETETVTETETETDAAPATMSEPADVTEPITAEGELPAPAPIEDAPQAMLQSTSNAVVDDWVALDAAAAPDGEMQTMAAGDEQTVTVASAQTLAEALVGANIEILNVTYTGHADAAGLFAGFEDAIGIGSGVILSTGIASELTGPNESGGTSTHMGTEGDSDLDALIEATTNDAAVLEIEFIPTHDTVAFTYVFGSEEYLEYVGSSFNDVFAFFVNGVNYATLDDGTVVSINNINHQENSEYFRDNSGSGGTEPAWDTELDGMTVVLSFEAPVNQGMANILKLAIADVSDSILDSAVMIQSGSFTSPVANTPPVADNKNVETTIDTAVVIVLTGSDADGDGLTYKIVNTDDLAGVLTMDGANVTFTPHAGFAGSTFFTYVVNDGQVDSDEATVTIMVDGVPVEIPVTPDPDAAPVDEKPADDTPVIKPVAETVEVVTAADTTVVEEAQASTDTLARTGTTTSAAFAMGGLAFIAAGAALMIWRRRMGH